MKTQGLNKRDRTGLFLGTILTFLMLPMAFVFAVIPAMMVTANVTSPVLAIAIKLGFLGIAAVLTFIQACILGLAISYFVGWLGVKLHVGESFRRFAAQIRGEKLGVESLEKTNYGALAGAALGLIFFAAQGAVPIHSVTSRVEHLFPGALVLSLGNVLQFDLGQVYSVATGFLAVGFLFTIAGIVIGSLSSAAIELIVSHQRK